MSRKPPAPVSTTAAVSRLELSWLLVILLAATLLRAGALWGGAIEHFDEGVYASNFWFGESQGHAYPARALYAPPLVPSLLEWTLVLGAIGGLSLNGALPLVPGAIVGVLTAGTAWHIARVWAGPIAGLTAALLVACSGLQITFSTTALTDPFVLLAILWAVHEFGRGVVLNEISRTVTGGLLTGLAWWCKYTGWLPLAIVAAATLLMLLAMRRDWRRSQRAGGASEHRAKDVGHSTPGPGTVLRALVVFWIVGAAGGAALIYTLGGWDVYAAIAANQRQYVHGLLQWPATLFVQADHQQAFIGWSDLLGAAIVPWLIASLRTGAPGSSRSTTLLWSLWAALLVLALHCHVLLGIIVAWLVVSRRLRAAIAAGAINPWFRALFGVWFLALSITVPFYYPYARLTLPWHLAALMLIAAAVGTALSQPVTLATAGAPGPEATTSTTSRRRRKLPPQSWLALLAIAMIAHRGVTSGFIAPTWPMFDRRASQRLADDMRAAAERREQGEPRQGSGRRENDTRIYYVFGEPALFYHLQASQAGLIAPVQDLGFVDLKSPLPIYLVVGPHATRMVEFQRQWSQLEPRFEPLLEQTVEHSPLVWRDQGSHSGGATMRYNLYRLRQ